MGLCALDHVFVSPSVRWGNLSTVIEYLVQGGGLIGTAITACARLGASCKIVSLLGDDSSGDQIISELNGEGISTEGIIQVKGGKSTLAFVHVDNDTGERTIFYRPGSGLTIPGFISALDEISKYDVLLVDNIYPDLTRLAIEKAHLYRIPVIADMVPDIGNFEILKNVDILIAPKQFASQLGYENDLNKALNIIHEMGPTTAVITRGVDGWIFSSPSGVGEGDAFKVDVVDTTGAGDSYHGAFAYALTFGWDTYRCCEFASAVAAIKCIKLGGRTGLPSFAQTINFLKINSKFKW